MGTASSIGVCYKSKPHFVTKDDILKALSDKIIKERIQLRVPLIIEDASKE